MSLDNYFGEVELEERDRIPQYLEQLLAESPSKQSFFALLELLGNHFRPEERTVHFERVEAFAQSIPPQERVIDPNFFFLLDNGAPNELFQFLGGLQFHRYSKAPQDLRKLAQHPYIRSHSILQLNRLERVGGALEAFLDSPYAPQLAELRLHSSVLHPTTQLQLWAHPRLTELKELQLTNLNLHHDEIAALVQHAKFAGLSGLYLHLNATGFNPIEILRSPLIQDGGLLSWDGYHIPPGQRTAFLALAQERKIRLALEPHEHYALKDEGRLM